MITFCTSNSIYRNIKKENLKRIDHEKIIGLKVEYSDVNISKMVNLKTLKIHNTIIDVSSINPSCEIKLSGYGHIDISNLKDMSGNSISISSSDSYVTCNLSQCKKLQWKSSLPSQTDILIWLKDNMSEGFALYREKILFEDETDMTLAKLYFGVA